MHCAAQLNGGSACWLNACLPCPVFPARPNTALYHTVLHFPAATEDKAPQTRHQILPKVPNLLVVVGIANLFSLPAVKIKDDQHNTVQLRFVLL